MIDTYTFPPRSEITNLLNGEFSDVASKVSIAFSNCMYDLEKINTTLFQLLPGIEMATRREDIKNILISNALIERVPARITSDQNSNSSQFLPPPPPGEKNSYNPDVDERPQGETPGSIGHFPQKE